MQQLPHSKKVAHPETGEVTKVWTMRRAAKILNVGVDQLRQLERVGMIPASIYGKMHRSPLWSLKQISLIAPLLKWLRAYRRDNDKFAEAQVRRQQTWIRKEWNDDKAERLRHGDQRNARWRTQRKVNGG